MGKKSLRPYLAVFIVICVLVSQMVFVFPLPVMAGDIQIPVPNGDFEDEEEYPAWTKTGTAKIEWYWDHTYDDVDGQGRRLNFSWDEYEAEAYQTITNLENGDYVLKAFIRSGGNHSAAYMYAKDFSEKDDIVKVDIPVGDKWGEIELEVTVTNGQMTIGFYGYGEKGSDAWMDIDDVTLWKKGESSGLPKTVDVPNGGFEDNPNTVWVTTGDAFAVKLPDTNDPRTGNARLNFWADQAYRADVYQTISGLENGVYLLKAYYWCGGSLNEAYMYATDFGTGDYVKKANFKADNNDWEEIELEIVVTNGQMTFGFCVDGQGGSWCVVDDVTLVQTKAEIVLEPSVSITVPNGDIEDEENTAWILEGAVKIQALWDHTYNNGTEGKKLSFWLDSAYKGEAYQTIKGLTNGVYLIKAYVWSGGDHNEAYMYAKDFGADDYILRANIDNTSNWEEIELEVVVTNGQITIGFYDNGQAEAWYNVDDVTLTKIKEFTTGEAEEQPEGIDVPNRGFEDNLDSWTVSGDTEAAFVTTGVAYRGDRSLELQSSDKYQVKVYQTFTDLEEGYYTLTAWVQNGGNQNALYLYGKPSGYSESRTALPKTSKWEKVYVRGLHVTDGKLTIGLFADANEGNWARIDHVELVKDDRPFEFLIGGDVSQLTFVESNGGKYYDAEGNEKDLFQILKENGHNIVRIRLYNNPGPGRGNGEYYCPEGIMDKEDVLKLSKRAKEAGMQIQFTFHYSDYWSNGGTQIIPYEWQEQIKDLKTEEEIVDKLEDLVYEYTKEIMQALKDQGTLPEYVSLGNEMQSGLLYPYGRASSATWPNLARFLKAGYNAVKEVSGGYSKVILHLDDAGNYSKYYGFFDNCAKYDVEYDIIGPSYYPFWTNKDVKTIIDFCNALIDRYDKEIMIMESGFNWHPVLPNGLIGQLNHNGPYGDDMSTPEGQRDFMLELFNGLKSAKNGMVIGDLYWDPIFIEVPGVGWAYSENGTVGDPSDDFIDVNVVSNTTLFDFDGKALPVMNAYKYNVCGVTTGMITGVVEGADGRRISGANVSTIIDGKIYSARTDLNGNFMLIDLPEGSGYELTASKEGYQSGMAVSGTVLIGEITNVDIKITGGAIAGTVTDQDGKPAEGAEVSVTIGHETYITTTDSHGKYTLIDLPEGMGYTVTASKDGYETGSVSDVDVTIGETASGKDMVITLNSGTITGQVTDDSGKPVEGAAVSVVDGNRIRTAITDEQGNYSIINVTSASGYIVRASKEGYIDGTAEGISVTTGKTTENANITLMRNVGSITGIVTNSDGEPVAGAKVTAVSGQDRYVTTSDALGTFEFEDILAGRDYILTASKDGYYDGKVEGVSVAWRETTSDVEIRLITPITVVNYSFEEPGTDNDPLPGWVVESTPPAATYRQDRRSFGGDARDGHYTFSTWLDGPFTSNVYQTLTGLKNGKYHVSLYIYHGITKELYMYAKDTGNPEVRLNIPNLDGWRLYEMEVIVSNGQMTIGVYQEGNAGDWYVSDLVTVGYYGPATDDEPATPPGGGGGSRKPVQPEKPVVNVEDGMIELPEPKVDSTGTATVETIKDTDFNKALETAKQDEKGVKTVVIDVPAAENAKVYEIGIAKTVLAAEDAAYKVEISTEVGKVQIPANMLSNADIGDADNVTISIGIADIQDLDEDVKAQIGDRPVIELNLKVDGKMTSWNNPGAPVTVSVPYTPTAEEQADSEHIVVWYIEGSGNVISVPTGRYNVESGTVTFTTTHFSKYAVSFVKKTFEDLKGVEWAAKPIEVLASKGAIAGTSQTTYSPRDNITRADFLCILVRALGLDAEFTSNFDDVKPADHFYREVVIAKALGIASGIGDNKFDPRAKITRQDMMVLAARTLAYTGKLELTGTAADLSEFMDAQEVSSYAIESAATLVKEGLIFGSNNKIHPKENTTRAEAAAIIYRLYNLQ